jgi:aminoglycoside 3-N-acetyltransferase
MKGDTVLIHSAISRTLRAARSAGAGDASPLDLLESFREAVGPDGSLLIPLFNFDFTKGIPFDIRTTPSQMGAFTEAARTYPGAIRTGHPIYSFAVLGPRSGEAAGIRNFSGYGEDSPFAYLRQWNGKIAVLDLPDQNSMTFYHHVEEMAGVDYRFHKEFSAPYTSLDGKTADATFGLFVRDVARGVKTHVDPMGEYLWSKGLYKGDRPGTEAGLRLIEANALFEETLKIIRAGKAEGMLYRIEKDQG